MCIVRVDIIRKVSSIPGEVENALITVSPVKPLVVLCDTEIGHRSVVNYEAMNVIFRSDDSLRESMIPMFTSTDIISFGMSNAGSVISFDIRDGKQTNTIDLKGIRFKLTLLKQNISRVSGKDSVNQKFFFERSFRKTEKVILAL